MPRIAFLPLYVKLYDDIGLAELRAGLDAFYETTAAQLEGAGLAVQRLPVCRVKEEFAAALAQVENADALVTLHLAYSPSLESVEELRGLPLPIVAMDTTPDETLAGDFVMPNHGIHGVQDMCSLLARHGKSVTVLAGPPGPALAARVARRVQVLAAAAAFRRSRVGRVGNPFPGMGDFVVDDETLAANLGIATLPFDFAAAPRYRPTPQQVQAEYERDKAAYKVEAAWDEDYRASLEAGLMLRAWAEEQKLDALTFTFFDITKACGIPRVPFWEAGKMMARGLGYAGEGDVITAALCGALMRLYPKASFAEMFCPDWQRGLVFLSHMGEVSTAVCDTMTVSKKPYDFSDCGDVVCGFGCFAPGPAAYVSLTPTAAGYRLVAAAVEMVPPPVPTPGTVAGWMKPTTPLPQFLERFSEAGGTHHGVVLYGAAPAEIGRFAAAAGLEYTQL